MNDCVLLVVLNPTHFDNERNRYGPVLNNDFLKQRYNELTQPVIYAVEQQLPMIAKYMLEKGASSNTLTSMGQKVLFDTYSRQYNKGETLLDLIDKKIEELQPAIKSTTLNPIVLENDQYHLGDSVSIFMSIVYTSSVAVPMVMSLF